MLKARFARVSLALAILSTCVAASSLEGQTPTLAQVNAKVDSLRAEVAAVAATVGTQYVGKSSEELKAALIPANVLPGGRYPLFLSDYQIRVGIAAIDAKIPTSSANAPASATSTSPAVSSGPTIAGLNSSEISAVVSALNNGVANGMPIANERSRIQAELGAGIYSYGDRSLIDAVKLWYYSGASSADQAALYKYLAIIDQRDPNNKNNTLAAGDPRWAIVSGSASSSSTPTSVVSSGVLYVSQIVVGNCLHPDSNAPIHVCSAGDGAISFESGVGGSKPSVGMVSLGGDHGLRLCQNCYTSVNTHPAYDPVGMVNYQSNLIEGVDPNYPESIIGADSQGRFSMVVKPSRASGLFDNHEYTQDLAFGFDESSKTITLESWRPGWRFQFVTSSGFRTIDRRFTVPTQ